VWLASGAGWQREREGGERGAEGARAGAGGAGGAGGGGGGGPRESGAAERARECGPESAQPRGELFLFSLPLIPFSPLYNYDIFSVPKK
jgi:hypothetical protein